jgi:peptidyl-prolyl cis-trans isomerase D
MTSAPISAQGVDQTGQPVAGLTPDLLQTAFALPSGGESELIEAGKGEFYAVRVERIVPAAMPPLAEIRAPLAQQWMLTETLKRLKIKADELAARIRKGESIEAVAASAGSRVQRVAGISRENAQQYQGLGRDVLIASFRAKPGEAFTARAPSLGFVVGKIDAVKAADPVQMARITEDQRPQATMTVFRDVGESARAGARAALKTKVNLVAAQQAIGVDTTALAKDKDPKSGKAGAKDQ